MPQKSFRKAAIEPGLVSIGLTLCVWAYIFTNAPAGAFRNQGGMLITLILFPLTLLGWVIATSAGIILGMRASKGPGGKVAGRGPSIAVGILLAMLGLALSFGTCIVPETLAQALMR